MKKQSSWDEVDEFINEIQKEKKDQSETRKSSQKKLSQKQEEQPQLIQQDQKSKEEQEQDKKETNKQVDDLLDEFEKELEEEEKQKAQQHQLQKDQQKQNQADEDKLMDNPIKESSNEQPTTENQNLAQPEAQFDQQPQSTQQADQVENDQKTQKQEQEFNTQTGDLQSEIQQEESKVEENQSKDQQEEQKQDTQDQQQQGEQKLVDQQLQQSDEQQNNKSEPQDQEQQNIPNISKEKESQQNAPQLQNEQPTTENQNLAQPEPQLDQQPPSTQQADQVENDQKNQKQEQEFKVQTGDLQSEIQQEQSKVEENQLKDQQEEQKQDTQDQQQQGEQNPEGQQEVVPIQQIQPEQQTGEVQQQQQENIDQQITKPQAEDQKLQDIQQEQEQEQQVVTQVQPKNEENKEEEVVDEKKQKAKIRQQKVKEQMEQLRKDIQEKQKIQSGKMTSTMQKLSWAFQLKAQKAKLDTVKFSDLNVEKKEFQVKDIEDIITITIEAQIQDLPKKCNVRCRLMENNNKVLGRSEIVRNQNPVEFKKKFHLKFDFSELQVIYFDLLNLDLNYVEEDGEVLGQAQISFKELLYTTEFPIKLDIVKDKKNKGKLSIFYHKMVSDYYGFIHLAADSLIDLQEKDIKEQIYLKVIAKQPSKGVTTVVQTLKPEENEGKWYKFPNFKQKEFLKEINHNFIANLSYDRKQGVIYEGEFKQVAERFLFFNKIHKKYGRVETYVQINGVYEKDKEDNHYIIVQSNDPDDNILPFTYHLDVNLVDKYLIKLQGIRLLSLLYIVADSESNSLWMHEPKFEQAVLKIQKKAREIYFIYEENFQFFYIGDDENDNTHLGFFIKGRAKLVRRLCFYTIIISLNDSNQVLRKDLGKLSKSNTQTLVKYFYYIVVQNIQWSQQEGLTFDYDPSLLILNGQRGIKEQKDEDDKSLKDQEDKLEEDQLKAEDSNLQESIKKEDENQIKTQDLIQSQIKEQVFKQASSKVISKQASIEEQQPKPVLKSELNQGRPSVKQVKFQNE